MDKTLDEIAISYGTDKSSVGHNYMPLYEKHLPKSVGSFLEIGSWKGAGIRTFKEWYKGEGKFYVIDRFIQGWGLMSIPELQAVGINAYDGDHDQMWFLETIKERFNVIIDDGSHHWLSQLTIFRRMFIHNVEPGGLYVVEDAFDDPYWGQGIITDPKENIKGLMNKFLAEGNIVSPIITPAESDKICPLIESVDIYDEIIFIKKK